MTNPCISQDAIDQSCEAIRQGAKTTELAGKIVCNSSHLPRQLDRPSLQPIPEGEAEQHFDLLAVDRLDAVV